MTEFLNSFRRDDDVIPFDAATKPWIDKCEPELLPLVKKDLKAIMDLAFDPDVLRPVGVGETPFYIASAGPPCVAKSTELDRALCEYSNFVIGDPDRYVMEYMNYTYRPLMSAGMKAEYGHEAAAKRAYELARPGSNIIANLTINRALRERYNLAHGTTMTGPASEGLLRAIGERGYKRILMLCWAEEATREDMRRCRIDREAHYQVTDEDFVQKGLAFPQRMAAYFKQGDVIGIKWKDSVEGFAHLAAVYDAGKIKVFDSGAFEAFKNKYNADRFALVQQGKELPSWQDMEQSYFNAEWKRDPQSGLFARTSLEGPRPSKA